MIFYPSGPLTFDRLGTPCLTHLIFCLHYRQAGKRVVYVTNNGTKSRREYVKKCQDLGFGGDYKDIFTTSYLCAKYLQNQGFNKKVYLFGNKVCSYAIHT